MARPCFKLEKVHPDPVAGVDEAGCAPLAGPVVAAAVVLDRSRFPRGIDDSQGAAGGDARGDLRAALQGRGDRRRHRQRSRRSTGSTSIWARMLAMSRAVDALGLEPAMVLVDGNRCPRWERPSIAIVAGDAKCRSIAAASIVAKVTRDRIMADYARDHPGYGWETQQGLSDARAFSARSTRSGRRRSTAAASRRSGSLSLEPVSLSRHTTSD